MSEPPVKKLVWLASFPKSGNTWLRVFLANYIMNSKEPFPINKIHMLTFSDMMGSPYEKLTGKLLRDLSDIEIHSFRPRVHRALASQKADVMLVKTHQAVLNLQEISTVTLDVTKASIYILRNPFDVAVSYAHHCGLQPSETLKLLSSKRHNTRGDGKTTVPQYLGRWCDHVRSWVDDEQLSPLVLRYEDMKQRPEIEFAKAVQHLGMKVDEERLRRAIRFSSFDELASQESEDGFVERARNADRFFRGGRVGDGLACFTEAEVESVIEDHRAVLQRFRYLDGSGQLTL
ncbi:sulfotransferase domain-containing protein [Denitrobaculum tricleocarpae]|uniref:Sulfotransferase domain-containing protein n=1 Tax=Denitrobaculum tricleocarpae TaxID=2591009 RepID=A0A545TRH3_9PROT|nr:sulfotransferase domain-containing protein [Denitrobaculum tricleocarpae]TQV79816.1 sulfotransferase domain-containing protein [Denitrobaculum tricleocarpae]